MNLRDQLKKARLLSDKEARRLAHEERVDRKSKGREQLDQEHAERDKALQQVRDEERRRTAQQQKQLEERRKQDAEAAAVDAILREQAQKPHGGPVRFYFEAPDGSLPWLEVTARQAQELTARQVCVVRHGAPGCHDYRLLPLELLRRVAKVRPEVVVLAPKL